MFRKRLAPFNKFLSSNSRIYLTIVLLLILLLALVHSVFWVIPGGLLLFGLNWFLVNQAQKQRSELESFVDSLVLDLEKSTFYALQNLPTPSLIFDHKGDFIWCNDAFKALVSSPTDLQGLTPDKLSADLHISLISLADGDKTVQYQNRTFNVNYKGIMPKDSPEKFFLLYMHDVTSEEDLKKQFDDEKIVLGYVQIDNITDVTQGMSDGQRSTVISEISIAVSDWISELHGSCKKVTDDTFFIILHKQDLQALSERKFDILDKIRDIREGNKVAPTLSIGVATGEETIIAVSQKAQSCLDLALGRGGDQAVLAIDGVTQFFGGKTIALEKNTRVRSRIVAQSLRDLMEEADAIFVMGHTNEDYDSIGATLGVAKMATLLNKPVHIVFSGRSSSWSKAFSLLPENNKIEPILYTPAQAETLITPNSILFLIDHHRPSLSAAPQLLALTDKKIIIDHHRRAEDIVKDCMLIYLEPASSSSCELVTELTFYFSDKPELSRFEASMLYAGIVLDTKHFINQTGSRTFEAAATLRRSGADPALVRQLFSDDLLTTKIRAELIAQTQSYAGGFLLSVHEDVIELEGASIAIAQAADFLLLTEGATCAIVVANIDAETTVISARSNGKVNMQIVMEAIGGGGHHTVAGVQLKNAIVPEIKNKIIELVQKQLEENNL